MVTLGIPTYNRIDMIKKMADSLRESDISVPVNIRIYDDASTDFDVSALWELFPEAASIKRNEKNLKADQNMWIMYSDFLNTDDEYFFNCDSDLIFSKGWLNRGLELLKRTDGVLSLFNTPVHAITEDMEDVCVKNEVGGAGTLFTRECIESIVKEMKIDSFVSFDWNWSVFLQDKGKRIFSVKNSLVQHIGIKGQNARVDAFDYGDGFTVDSMINGQIINDMCMDYFRGNSSTPFRGWLALFPYPQVPVHSRIVIYGAGKAGKDFLRQMEFNNYCEVAAVIDAKKFDSEYVFPVEKLEDGDYDHIILAAASVKVQDDMEKDITGRYPELKSKIVKPDVSIVRLDPPR